MENPVGQQGSRRGAMLLALVAQLVALAAGAQSPTPAQNRAADVTKAAGFFPFRLDGTNIVNLHPVINYYAAVDAAGVPRMTNRPLADWELVQGRVVQPAPDSGLIVDMFDPLDWFQRKAAKQVHLVNHPNLGRLPADGSVAVFAQYKKEYKFVVSAGLTNLIPEYDCGPALKGTQLQQAETEWREFIKARQALQKETIARITKENQVRAAEQKAKRAAEQDKKAFAFYVKKASEGDDAAQYRLAEFYLMGRGTATNVEAARLWLTAARTNGNSQAEARLQALDKKE